MTRRTTTARATAAPGRSSPAYRMPCRGTGRTPRPGWGRPAERTEPHRPGRFLPCATSGRLGRCVPSTRRPPPRGVPGPGPTGTRPDGRTTEPVQHRTSAGDLWQAARKRHRHAAFRRARRASTKADIPTFRAGDTVKVHVKVVEGTRSRIQVFQGVVIRRHGGGVGETFTVRKVSFGVGVERTFPRSTPRSSTGSRSSPVVTCVARSSTTCATCAARPPRSRRSARPPSPGRAPSAIRARLPEAPTRLRGVTARTDADPVPATSVAGAGRAVPGGAPARRRARPHGLRPGVVIQSYVVPSAALAPAVEPGDRLLVEVGVDARPGGPRGRRHDRDGGARPFHPGRRRPSVGSRRRSPGSWACRWARRTAWPSSRASPVTRSTWAPRCPAESRVPTSWARPWCASGRSTGWAP